MTNPSEVLQAGCGILDEVLVPHGFSHTAIRSGQGSGGPFASTEYVRGERRLEVHFRESLGLVAYHDRNVRASHQAYMRQVLGSAGGNQYPGFSRDPLDGFRHLAHDLRQFGADFLQGPATILRQAAQAEAAVEAREQARNNAGSAGDLRNRQQARELFRQGDYAGVVKRLRSLRYPEQMTEAERKLLNVAEKRAAEGRPPRPWWRFW